MRKNTWTWLQLELIEDDIALAQLDVNDAMLEELDIDLVLNYATNALQNARSFGFSVLRIKNRIFSECCFQEIWSSTARVIDPFQPVLLLVSCSKF